MSTALNLPLPFDTIEPLTALKWTGLCLLSYILFRILRSGHRESRLPPGPPTLPILGNIHQIPTERSFLQFTKWARKYGPIFSLKVGSGTIIVLSDGDSVKQVLDKQSAVSSSRPPFHVGYNVITHGNHLGVMPYGDDWRQVRRVMANQLSIKQCQLHHQRIQEAESTQVINDVLLEPSDFLSRVRRFSPAVILAIIYGKRGPRWESKEIQDIYVVMQAWSRIMETGNTPPIDIWPFLKYLPDFMSEWRARAKKLSGNMFTLYHSLVDEVRERRKRGIVRDCLMDKILEEQEAPGFDKSTALSDDKLAFLGGVLMEGGSDTTASQLASFMLAMTKYPHVLTKAQEEVDRVIGRERLPTFADWDKLPYINCCVKEILRWRPVAVNGFPHCLTADVEYNGYLLPKGSTVLLNIWGIHHDPQRYENPEDFNPDRFAPWPKSADAYTQTTDPNDRDHYSYGAGRRICVGIHISERNLFINISKLVWAFNFKQKGEKVLDDSPTGGYSPGFVIAPWPYECIVEARDESVKKVVEREMEKAMDVIREYS